MQSLKELEQKYNLELNRIISEIKKTKAKQVLIQLPDGIKQYASAIVNYLQEKTNAEFHIWLGTCFGACDIPNTKADLIIQFGHAPWKTKVCNEA